MNRRRLTSIDLAKLAGVSSATISRAFTPGSRISSATRARILSLADEHSYRPNAVARSLNSSRSRLVALVVNAIANPCEAQQLDMLVHRLQRDRAYAARSLLRRPRRPHATDAFRIGLPGRARGLVFRHGVGLGRHRYLQVRRADHRLVRAGGRPVLGTRADRRRGGLERGRRAPGQWRQASLRLPLWPRLQLGRQAASRLVRLGARAARIGIRRRGARRLLVRVRATRKR